METLLKIIKPVVTEKHEFEDRLKRKTLEHLGKSWAINTLNHGTEGLTFQWSTRVQSWKFRLKA